MKLLSLIFGIIFTMFSICAEASENESDVVNLPMSVQAHEVIVSKDNSTIFMLPLNQKLMEIRGGDVVLGVDGKLGNGIETKDWIVSFTRKRGNTKHTRWTYRFNIKLQPKKDVAGTEFEFVTDKWVHRVVLSSGMEAASLVVISDDRFFNFSGVMDFVLKMDPIVLMGVSILVLLGSLCLFFKRWIK